MGCIFVVSKRAEYNHRTDKCWLAADLATTKALAQVAEIKRELTELPVETTPAAMSAQDAMVAREEMEATA
jgi:hypothetical protein